MRLFFFAHAGIIAMSCIVATVAFVFHSGELDTVAASCSQVLGCSEQWDRRVSRPTGAGQVALFINKTLQFGLISASETVQNRQQEAFCILHTRVVDRERSLTQLGSSCSDGSELAFH